ncbi:hypothetical protein [Flavobacterium foetidum]|uniref:hypothetical protein n=1 Tax=Flavobacterium foetidum TaxID=2026681 RepID=UPI001074D80F|nr:hypothetical protein [Flavobacterium foetidum]KAF2509133.1 hypothetical protein E0W73_19185 [Flavobacterium foetidum]
MKKMLNGHKTKIAPIAIFLAITFIFTACTKKGEPSKQGQLLTIEQVKSLEKDQSLNGKLVEIEGYPAICGMFGNVRVGEKNKMEIRTEPDCKGEKLIEVNLFFGGDKIRLSGEEERNVALATEKFTNATLKYITDDYQELPTGKFKFSGTLIYINNTYYLDNVTIHK